MAKLTSTTDDTNAAGALKQGPFIVDGNARTVHFARQLGNFLQNKYIPTIMILSVYTNEMNIYAYTKFCVWMFIVTLVVIAKSWKPKSWKPKVGTIGNEYQTVRWQGDK